MKTNNTVERQSIQPEAWSDATISMAWANTVALLIIPVALLILGLPYWLLGGRLTPSRPLTLFVLLAFVVGILVHELLHLVGFVWAGKVPLTAVKIGFSWKAMAPYAHTHVPMPASAYRLSLILPGLVLGILPGILGVIWGSFLLLLWGILMIVAAGGDLAVLQAIRHIPGSAWVRDHPSKPGCQVIKEQNNE